MNKRIKSLQEKIAREGLDALIVLSAHNISYLTYYASRDSYLVVSKKKNAYITDSRYIEEAKRSLSRAFAVKKIEGPGFKTIARACRRFKRVGFEERFLSYAEFRKLKGEFAAAIELIPASGLIEQMRKIKEKQEIAKIRQATQIAISAFHFIRDYISVGRKEAEIAAELERFIRYHGGRASSFDIIVASGPNSSFPHHLTGERKIKNNEPVLIDLGVDYQGYKSDLTRVFFLGKIKSCVRDVYAVVLKAQAKALQEIRPGVYINKIDTAARQYIKAKGYGGFFGHNLGHGIGLEVHEEPRISLKETAKLEAGMVFTVEPGVYLPNHFGIRIEDEVLVTQKGVQVLSGALHK
jgi:Xaa-Pro aminopeptidase